MKLTKILLAISIILTLFSLLLSFALPVFFIFFLLFLGCTVGSMAVLKKEKRIENLPALTGNAKIISKNINVTGSKYYTGTRYYITFELADGTRTVLNTSLQQYGLVLEGESGVLSYKEYGKTTKFIGFQKTTPLQCAGDQAVWCVGCGAKVVWDKFSGQTTCEYCETAKPN
ncbi:MAG: DUF2500 domain-containing protein [Oscillospiraceae bacterium]|nr:DUF2500 domain-containing protein [Oscillospiraceae bacterium]